MPRRYQTLTDLPGELAVFPLVGAILLPRAKRNDFALAA